MRRMSPLLALQLALLGAWALIGFVFGLRYLRAREFMPYHAAVTGRSWREIEPGMQAVLLGMLRIVGGGFIAASLAVLWLSLALVQHAPWAPWALLSVVLATGVPVLAVTRWLRRVQPEARTPVMPAAAALAIGVLACGLSLL